MDFIMVRTRNRVMTDNLSDSECGRLFKALLSYADTGLAPRLPGRESTAFAMFKGDIDRAKQKIRR